MRNTFNTLSYAVGSAACFFIAGLSAGARLICEMTIKNPAPESLPTMTMGTIIFGGAGIFFIKKALQSTQKTEAMQRQPATYKPSLK